MYLVNFVAGVREYYRFQDSDGDELVESGELIPILEADLPDSARPKLYDEEGNFVRYKTDAEDLQNFANWYSYFRRRELTAKAAVSNVIRNLAGVQVGFYSINTGLRQAVLPIKVDMGVSVIVDNRDSGYAESGAWRESGASNEYKGSSRYTRNAGNYATWRPDLP